MALAINQRSFSSATSFLRLAESSPSATFATQQITEIFHSSAPIDTAVADLSEKQVVSFSNLWKDPVTAMFGGLWSLLILFDIYCVVDSGVQLLSHLQEGASLGPLQETAGSASGLAGDLFKDLKKFLMDGVSLTGVSANLGDWAHRQNIISLGEAVGTFRMVGYGASCITCSVRAYSNGKELLERLGQFKEAQSDAELARLEQKQLLSGLDLAANSATALWAFMGIAALVAGVAVAPAWLIGLSNVAAILAISSLFYHIHMINLYPPGERQVGVV
ncbi:MAG: hypothetical protein AB7H48_04915 [Parachlamydiales bacterium]